MQNFLKIYNRIVLGHPIIMLIMIGAIFAFFSYHVKDFKLDASADSLMLEDDKDLIIYNQTIDRYDIKDFFFITFSPRQDLFTRTSLNRLENLRDQLSALDIVDSVISLLDIPLFKTSGISLNKISDSNLKTLKDPDVDLQAAKEEILHNPIYKNYILSPDGQTTAIQINLTTDSEYWRMFYERNRLLNKRKAGFLTPEEQHRLEEVLIRYEKVYDIYVKERHQYINRIRDIMVPFKEQADVHLGGIPMIADDMMAFIKGDLVSFGLGVFAFIVVTLALIFRRIRWVVLPLLCCFFAVILMIGMLGLMNWKVTVISSNFISLMLILTLSMNIHLIVRYRQLNREMDADQTEIVSMTMRKMVLPCLYTALTTSLAFSSLVFSGIKPVMDFGWMMTMGLAITFLTSFLLFPSILVLLKKSTSPSKWGKPPIINYTLARISEYQGGKVILISVLLAGLSVIGIFKLQVENSFINYFSKKTEIYRGMKLIDDKLSGTNPLDVVISFGKINPETTDDKTNVPATDDWDDFGDDEFSWVEDYDPGDYWITPYKINRIKAVHDYLDSLPAVGKVLSLASGIRVAEQLNNGKEFDSLELGVMYKKIPESIKTDWINPYISVDNNEARISLLVKDSLSTLRRKEFLERIHKDLFEKFQLSSKDVTITGLLVLYNNMLQSLFHSQILTLGIVLLGIGLMLFILFRSFVLAVLGIIPNMLAVGIVLGLMGWLKIPLDMMTITIAAITMGIAIDDCIHYIYRFKEEYEISGDYSETLIKCHNTVGRAVVNTSVVVIFGFSILVLSNFIPTIYFGVFTGLAMFIALMAILTLLPKMILLWHPFKS